MSKPGDKILKPIDREWQRVNIEALEITKSGYLGFAGAFEIDGIPHLIVCQTREALIEICQENCDQTKFKEVLVLHVASRTNGGHA